MNLATASIALLFLSAHESDARRQFVSRVPNGANVAGVSAIGHADDTGDSSRLSTFGRDFSSAGTTWTTALCRADSDGDGQTNGEELGDPCCEWKSGLTPKFASGVSHPGDAGSKVAASMLASAVCESSSNATSSNTTPVGASTPTTDAEDSEASEKEETKSSSAATTARKAVLWTTRVAVVVVVVGG